MTNSRILGVFVLLLALLLPLASADSCYVNGRQVSCSDFWASLGAFFVVFIIVIALCIIFWIWMLIDCAKRQFNDKLVWILIILLVGTLGAIIYYFVIKRKNRIDEISKQA